MPDGACHALPACWSFDLRVQQQIPLRKSDILVDLRFGEVANRPALNPVPLGLEGTYAVPELVKVPTYQLSLGITYRL